MERGPKGHTLLRKPEKRQKPQNQLVSGLGAIGVLFLGSWAPLAYMLVMAERLSTVAETLLFVRQAKEVWTEAEHDDFVLHIAGNPEAGRSFPTPTPAASARCDGAGQGPANAVAFG